MELLSLVAGVMNNAIDFDLIFVYFDPMAVVTELLGRPALLEYTNKANILKLNNMLKL